MSDSLRQLAHLLAQHARHPARRQVLLRDHLALERVLRPQLARSRVRRGRDRVRRALRRRRVSRRVCGWIQHRVRGRVRRRTRRVRRRLGAGRAAHRAQGACACSAGAAHADAMRFSARGLSGASWVRRSRCASRGGTIMGLRQLGSSIRCVVVTSF